VHGDVLVGADGIRSAVRAQLLSDGEPRDAGYTVWRAILECGDELVRAGSFCSLWGRGERFVFYDIGGGRLYWMSVANGAHAPTPPADVKAQLLQRHHGWMEPIEAMIERTPAGAIHQSEIIDRPPVERWGEGRATLLGDAAHPMTFNIGQGACQAIEDAVVLARELAGAGDVPAALRAYEAARRARTAKFQTLAWRLGRMGRWESRAACGLRDRLMRVTYNGFALKQHRADMAHAI
jgi:2-polyprenyl-6-methoxyphenol hydroxylase-like FAD-dependent oxidoreductase